ncbi:carbohydrate ABC transporter membrane protein 1 (CUT1 family) [Asanoa ferruginea]|uniref:Maltose/maltodextrin transport system permease protein n=1 Tax=Asanoa ferruginea TaxID=53367 RepID=A0A3D9ZRC9_9ACTN|nr:ABC transporter permease subunit [Asanoa ferruginea]REF99936.1 carbohydrate ABC transporter membrane protein 1 (CUT1 family) [Asanoa ferruginea]GIF53693.1 sugar ABC transporter permease [Asanoa ferruginea]
MARTDVPVRTTTPPKPRLGLGADGTASPLGLIIKIGVLGVVAAIAVWAAFPLIATGNWIGLIILVAVSALIFYVYLSPRVIPAKYLIPGTLFLIVFQVLPVLFTLSTAFTNFGDGHRGSKDEAIAAVEGASVQQVPGSTVYTLTLATDGDPATGDIVFLLTDPATKAAFVGTADGLEPLANAQQSADGKVTSAGGYEVLDIGQISARSADIVEFSVPTAKGAIKNQGLSRAFEGTPQQAYNNDCDCITDRTTGQTWTANGDDGVFVDGQGQALAQGWKVNVGFRNFAEVVTNPVIRASFLKILLWNIGFALGVVLITFGLGLLVALVLNKPELRGQRLYRSLIILPYAMPAVAMMLVWRDMFNTDFGLINRLFGLHVNWFGSAPSSMFAILLVQLWLGYNYMFLVSTGALQAIPADLTEAAQVDGARPFHAFRTITFPLLLVALAPLLISSFAFNFNNFTAIYLVSEGAPFPPDNPQAGATDILITYTYRLAFGGAGAQYGFAAAISVFIFLIVATISVVSFRRTHALEEIN